jgi:hypothetical protein
VLPLILATGLLLHVSDLTAPFFGDDYVFLDHVRFRSFTQAVFSADPLGNYFRPVGRQLYFWVNAVLSNESPVLFHAVNVGLFLLSIALLYFLTKRLGGEVAAVVASGILAVHYAFDLPLRWISGSQDLLALAGSLTALWLYIKVRSWWAAPILFLALLCKETVVFTPFAAILIGRSETGNWKKASRQALPLLLAIVPWAILWALFGSTQVAPNVKLTFTFSGFLAALVQLVRVTFGIEWRTQSSGTRWTVFPLALVLLPLVIAVLSARVSRKTRPFSLGAGLGWALLGALPVAPIASIWSAYHFSFALAGAALALGIWTARYPRWLAAIVVAVLACSSQGARNINEFSIKQGRWSAQSHMNRWWFDRGAGVVKSYSKDLRQLHPTVPSRSTFFFYGVPGYSIGHCGPFVRWTYRDSSVRGYYLRDFSLQSAGAGPIFFLQGEKNRLFEPLTGKQALRWTGAIMLARGNVQSARDALVLEHRLSPTNEGLNYCQAWVEWALGDTTIALSLIDQAGITPNPTTAPEVAEALRLYQSGRLQEALAVAIDAVHGHGLNAGANGLLADLLFVRDRNAKLPDPMMFFAAFAARVLDPLDPGVWKRWGMLQFQSGLYAEAKQSLEEYLTLVDPSSPPDAETVRILKAIPSLLPGGERVQRGISRDLLAPAW